MLLISPTATTLVASEEAILTVAEFDYGEKPTANGLYVRIYNGLDLVLEQEFSGPPANRSNERIAEVMAPQYRRLASSLGGPIRIVGQVWLPPGWRLEEELELDASPAFKAWIEAAKADLKGLGGKGSSAELARLLGVSQQTLNQAEKGHKAVSVDRLANWLFIWGKVASPHARRWSLEVGEKVDLKAVVPVGFCRVVDTFNQTIVSRHPTLSGAMEAMKLQNREHSWHKIQVKTEKGWEDATLENT